MAASLEETLVSVWRQALVESAKRVALEDSSFPVRRTSRRKATADSRQFIAIGDKN